MHAYIYAITQQQQIHTHPVWYLHYCVKLVRAHVLIYPFRRVRRKVIYEYAYISGSRPEKYSRVYSNIIIHDLTRSDKKICCAFYNLVDTYDKPYNPYI